MRSRPLRRRDDLTTSIHLMAHLSNGDVVSPRKLPQRPARRVHRPHVLLHRRQPPDDVARGDLFLEPLIALELLDRLLEGLVALTDPLPLPEQLLRYRPLDLSPHPEARERNEGPLPRIEAPTRLEQPFVGRAADLVEVEQIPVTPEPANGVAMEKRAGTEREQKGGFHMTDSSAGMRDSTLRNNHAPIPAPRACDKRQKLRALAEFPRPG